MSDNVLPDDPTKPLVDLSAPPPPPPAPMVPAPAYAAAPVAASYAAPVGKIRGTGVCILLAIVTLGIYSLVWTYAVHKEMKEHTGQGLGGGLALLLQFFVGIVMPYITASEVGGLYTRSGRQAPVSGATGLWYFPGVLILIGPVVWFVKTNGAVNDYWRAAGAH